MNSIRFFAIVSVICLVAVSVQAVSWKGGEGNWSSANWNDWEPTANDSAVIWNGTAIVTETGEICKNLQLGGGAGDFHGILNMESGSLEIVKELQAGPVGKGTINLTGGLLKANTIVLSQDRFNPSTITISGTAEIQSYYLEVGWPGIGYVNQNGGTITTNELALTNTNSRVFKGEGYYTMNAGTLNAGAVYVGIYKGEFKVTNPGATINITDLFDIRPNGTLIAPAGTTLHLKGAKFLCKKISSSDIPDLANLTVSIEKRGAYESQLETMGADRGANASVLEENFTLDTITIEPGVNLRLINTVDNNQGETANDVAVVRQLNLGSGSTLFLNNNKMYCQDWAHNCSTVDWRSGGCLYVLNASYDMTMSASASEISADGQSECEISTVLTDRDTPICNAYVRFQTDKGTLVAEGTGSGVWAKTNAGGRATARLRSDTQIGKATVTASYMDFSKQVTVEFVKVKLSVTADPPVIPADGTSRSVIRATLEDKHLPVPDQSVLLQTEIGHFVTPGTGELVSSITLVTDADGKVIVELQSDTEEGGGYVTATFQDQTDRVLVDFIGYELTLSAAPIEIASGGQSYSTLKALVTRAGQPIAGKPVTFQATLGQLLAPGEAPSSQATVNTDESGRAMLLLQSANEPGDAAITATYEKLTRDVTVSFRADVLSLSATPDVIADAPTSHSEIILALMLDEVPAAGKSIIVSTDKGHLYDNQGNTTNTAQTDSYGKAILVFKPDGDEGVAAISAEYSDADVILNNSCAVTIQPIHLTLKVIKVDYSKIPDDAVGQTRTRVLVDPIPVQVTTHGKSEVSVQVQMDPLGVPEITGQTILLDSAEMASIGNSDFLDIPESVVTDLEGKAEFKVTVDSLWKKNPAFDTIHITAKWDQNSITKDECEIEVFNNWNRLIQLYEVNIRRGPVLEPEFWEYLRGLRPKHSDPDTMQRACEWLTENMDFLHQQMLSHGMGGGVNNILEWNLRQFKLPHEWNTRLKNSICGNYQGSVLQFLHALRANETSQGTTDWLLNGIDYGPLFILGGLHVAAMIYPRGEGLSCYLDWRANQARVLDPWPNQDPQGAVYTWEEWLAILNVSRFGIRSIASMSISSSPWDPVNQMGNEYPANCKPYPSAFHPSAYSGETNLIIHCPVDVTIEDDQGRRSGYLPDAGPETDSLAMEIPDVFFSTLRMPDDSLFWQFRLPDRELKVHIRGYENGNYTAFLVDPQGTINTYSDADIENTQTTELDYDPTGTAAPLIMYPDGSRILPDGVIEIDKWTHNSGEHRSNGTLKITNTTATAVDGPLRLIVESTTPDTIQLIGADGTDGGKPYLDLTALLGDGRLDPGESISRSIEFSNANREYFDLSVKLTGRTAEDKMVTARRKFKQVGIPKCSRDGLLPFDLAEGNAADWETWAADMEPEGTIHYDDLFSVVSGNSSIKCETNAPFDMYIRYGKTLTEPWNLSKVKKLFISFYALNDNFSFQNGSPWIRLKTDDDNFFEFQYFVDGGIYDLLNDCLWQWKPYAIPLDAPDNEENGWRRTTVGNPDWTQIRYLEIHADTWGEGFQLGVDGVGFDTDQAIYRDFNADCIVDSLDILTFAKHWLCPDCTPAACEGADIDLSGKVDLADFALFAEAWLKE